jgi:hypothetical protein
MTNGETALSKLVFEGNLKQLSYLADAMPQLVWVAEPNGKVIYYNSRITEFTGAQKLQTGHWSWDGLLHPEDREPTIQAWSDAVRTGDVYETEHRVHMADGSLRWYLSRALPQKNNKGEVLGWFGTATDIHEQKLVHERIKEAEERWRTALEATQIGTWDYNPTTKTFFLSDVARRMRGIGPEVANPFKMHRETIHPDDVQQVADTLQEALDLGEEKTFSMEYRVFRNKGEQLCWIRSIGRVIVDEDRKPKRVIGIMQDITEQKLADEKLQYLAALTFNIADAVIGTDTEYYITNWNKGAEETYGWKKEEVIGKKAREIVPTQFFSENDRQTWEQDLNSFGQWQGEVLQNRKDGQPITVMASVANVRDADGKQIGSVAINKDITEQRKAAEQLKESEERFRVLTNTIHQIVWIRGKNGKLEYLNDQWFNITGQTPEKGLDYWEDMIHPDEKEPLAEQQKRAFQSGEAYQGEYRVRNKNTGTYHWYFYNVQPLKDREGNIIRWIGAATDIQHFKDISVVLEQQVQERTTELQHLNVALEQQAEELWRSNEDLQQFAHVASHDLKEPLRKIKTYGSRLSDEYGHLLPAQARSFLEKMDLAASRMASMIDGVLGYSMIGTAEQIIEMVDLNDLMEQVENDLEISIHQKRAVIQYEQLPVINGIAILLYQLFYNLINNALKFSKAGVPPVITFSSRMVKGAEMENILALAPESEYAEIIISDNGIGFDQVYAERIFKTFTRLNAKDKYEGTGLGLSLCKKIVHRHHGLISATGRPGEGASFKVILPV